MRSPEEAFCMTLLSESYYCVSSLLKLTMTFQMLYDPTFYIQLRDSTKHPNGKEKLLTKIGSQMKAVDFLSL